MICTRNGRRTSAVRIRAAHRAPDARQHLTDGMQQTACSRRHAADDVQQTTCNRRHAAEDAGEKTRNNGRRATDARQPRRRQQGNVQQTRLTGQRGNQAPGNARHATCDMEHTAGESRRAGERDYDGREAEAAPRLGDEWQIHRVRVVVGRAEDDELPHGVEARLHSTARWNVAQHVATQPNTLRHNTSFATCCNAARTTCRAATHDRWPADVGAAVKPSRPQARGEPKREALDASAQRPQRGSSPGASRAFVHPAALPITAGSAAVSDATRAPCRTPSHVGRAARRAASDGPARAAALRGARWAWRVRR